MFGDHRLFCRADIDTHLALRARDSIDRSFRNEVAIERYRAARIVIPRNDISDAGRIAVGVDDGGHWNIEALSLLDRNVFLVGVDHEQKIGDAAHVLDAAERAIELVALALHRQALFLGVARGFARVQHFIELAQPRDRGRDRLPVGQRATEPARIYVILCATLGRVGDRILRLPLSADEKDAPAFGNRVAHGLQTRDAASAPSARDRRYGCCCECRRCTSPSSGSSGGPDGRSARQLPIADASRIQESP